MKMKGKSENKYTNGWIFA